MTEHNPTVEISVLGPLLVRVGGREHPIGAVKQRLLLARLVVSDGSVASHDELIDALWGEAPPATAAKNLQVLVGRLRAIVGRDAIRTEPGGYRLDTARCRVDASVFEYLVAEVDRRRADCGGCCSDDPDDRRGTRGMAWRRGIRAGAAVGGWPSLLGGERCAASLASSYCDCASNT